MLFFPFVKNVIRMQKWRFYVVWLPFQAFVNLCMAYKWDFIQGKYCSFSLIKGMKILNLSKDLKSSSLNASFISKVMLLSYF